MSDASDRRTALFTWLTMILISLIYLGIPCYSFFSDGLQFAIDVTYSPDLILHPHHFLYPLLPQLIYRLTGGTGSGMGALDFLAIFSQWITIAACVVFILTIRTAKLKWTTILAGLIFFAFSNGIWYFAVTPNQNSIALLFHVIALYVILQAGSTNQHVSVGRIFVIAILVALSILTSQVNAVLIIPALFVLVKNRENKIPGITGSLIFIFVTAVLLVAVFTLCGIYIGGFRSTADFMNWQHSYVFQQRWWPDSVADAFRRNLVGLFTVHIAEIFAPDALISNWLHGFGSMSWIRSLPLRFGQAFVVLFSLIELFRAAGLYFRTRYKNPVQTIGILAALPVLLFSFFFIPENINFRILYIPGFLLFVLPSIERRYSPDNFHPGKAWPVAVAAIALFLVNLTPSFLPASNPSSNPRLTEVGQLMEYVTPGDMIIYPWTDDGHTLSLYAQYFLGCDALTINKLIDLENAGGDQIISGLFGDSSDGRIIFVDAALVNVAGGSGSIASRYECELTQAEIDEFIDRWLVPADDEIPTINRHYIVYTPR